MSFSSYAPSLYTSSAVVNSGYNPVQIGSVSAGDCPTGSIQKIAGPIPVKNEASLSDIMVGAFRDTQAQGQAKAFEVPCCPNPAPCQEQVFWRASFKGCPYTYADDASVQCEVNPVGDRYMVADLEPLKFERALMQQAEPNPYDFMNARQMWMQFLMKDWVQRKDPYTRPLVDLDQSYCMQQNLNGPPAFTTF